MDRKPFGVQLKSTGVGVTRKTSSMTSTSTTSTTRASIHTPLKPANVKDLKAKFDSSKFDAPKTDSAAKSKTDSTTKSAVNSDLPSGVSSMTSSKPPEMAGVKVVRVSSTSSSSVSSPPTARRTKFNTQNVGSSLDSAKTSHSDSTDDLMTKYRSNRTGLYRNEHTSAATRDTSAGRKQVSAGSRQTSDLSNLSALRTQTSESRQTFVELKSVRTKSSLPDSEVTVPKLNLSQLSSDQMDILCGSSSPRSDSWRSSDSSPRSSASSSPRLVGNVKPKYFPSSRSCTKADGGRVEIPIHREGVSAPDSATSANSSSQQVFTKSNITGVQPRYGQVVVTEGRFRSNGTNSNSPYKISISPKQSVDGPIPWSLKTDAFHVESSKEFSEATGWLEKKNARNILSNFVSTQQQVTVTGEKVREIPIQRVNSADEVRKEKPGVSSQSTFISKKHTSFESKSNSVIKNNKEPKRHAQKVQFGATSNDGGVKSSILASKEQKLSVEKSSSVDSPRLSHLDRKMAVSRKMSSERFERLKFDFERGVAPNAQERRGSESTDHIELKKKVNELASTPREIKISKTDSFKRKEESIFASGLKVSDFVQQVNQLNPEPPRNAGRKWRNQQSKLKRSSVTIEDGAENEYLEVSDGDTSDTSFSEGIYELVPDTTPIAGCTHG